MTITIKVGKFKVALFARYGKGKLHFGWKS